ncbi:hypothetical protein CALCODRAFT_552944 [Calocera cornea HHB12733]|uniref:BTB domain-containing protein n=1 Tax=Calocera cornea HHB12733 TaxID=1353952 RepID=A0A165JIZ8_9BASI|nr:hypothetical protein CALCODRAFT_552944 [Calocera cornea HHB12733]
MRCPHSQGSILLRTFYTTSTCMKQLILLHLDLMEDPTRYCSGSVGTTSGTTTPRANGDAALPNEPAVPFRIYGRPPQVDEQFGGDTVILVENTLFHIPTYLLTTKSELFQSLFSLSPGSTTDLRHTLEEAPIDINRAEPSITADAFRAFAKALTSPAYNPAQLSPVELTSALDLSKKWAFTTLYNHLLAQLASGRDPHTNLPTLLPYERVRLAVRYLSQSVLEQALVDQCLSLTPPDMQLYNALLECLGAQSFLDLLEARRLVWGALRADHPRRKGATVWTECERRGEWCHSNWLFSRALADVVTSTDARKARNAPYTDFDAAFSEALDRQARAVRREVCATCRRKMVERMSWFVDSAQLFDIVRNTMGPGMLDNAPPSSASGAAASSSQGLQAQATPTQINKGKAKAVQTASTAGAANCKPTAAGYLWNSARGLPVEGAAQHTQWERFMSLAGEAAQATSSDVAI